MAIKINYDTLVTSKEALDVILAIRGLKPADKLLLAKTVQRLRPDMAVIEDLRVELVRKYAEIGRQRQEDQLRALAEKQPDEADKNRILEGIKNLKANEVQQQELADYRVEYTEFLKLPVTVEAERIPLGLIISDQGVLPSHIKQLSWLTYDDTEKTAEPEESDDDALARAKERMAAAREAAKLTDNAQDEAAQS